LYFATVSFSKKLRGLKLKKLEENFVKWACSLSGCDGGSPKAKILISGIEWGLDKKYEEEYYSKTLPTDIKNGEFCPPKEYDLKEAIKFRYNQRAVKLYCSIVDKDFDSVVKESDGSEIFKANLYPIAFNKTSNDAWDKYSLKEKTGFDTKYMFKTWCFLHRFPAISEIVRRNSPRLIIGTGVSYLTDFFACYAGYKNTDIIINSDIVTDEKREGETRRYYWSKLNDKTTLVVVPFLSGKFGLNSDSLIERIGKKIRKDLAPDL
jgi:hypothetical protein